MIKTCRTFSDARIINLQVNEVLDDWIANLYEVIDPETMEVDDFRNEIYRWTLECKQAKYIPYSNFRTQLNQ